MQFKAFEDTLNSPPNLLNLKHKERHSERSSVSAHANLHSAIQSVLVFKLAL